MNALGDAIRRRRQRLGLTQEELADRMAQLGDENIRQSDISRIELGQVQLPRYNRLVYISQALEVSLGELFILAGWAETGQPGEEEPDIPGNPESLDDNNEPPSDSDDPEEQNDGSPGECDPSNETDPESNQGFFNERVNH